MIMLIIFSWIIFMIIFVIYVDHLYDYVQDHDSGNHDDDYDQGD